MATQTRPFLTRGVALASAAAIAVATPAIAPNLAPTPTALSAAQVELTTFADLLSITPADWNNYLFVGWGGALGPINPDPEVLDPTYYVNCDYDCTIPGVSGLAYLALDALINGNGAGIQNVNGILNPDYDPDEPIGPDNEEYLVQPWGTSALNYFFEGSFSTGLQYIAQSPFAPGAPLANEQIFNAIALAFQGEYALTTLYVQALSTIAVLSLGLPLVGEYVYRGIGSYIGPAFSTVDSFYDYSFYAGISGILRYVGGVITTGGNPNPYPTPTPEPTAAVSAASVVAPVVAALKADAPKAAVEAPQADTGSPEAASSGDGAGSSAAGTEAPVADVEAPTAGDFAEADASATESTETPADTTAAVESPSTAVAETVAEAPARTAKRPVRNAVERATKKIASALGGSTSGSATGGAAESGATTGGAAAGGAATGGAAAGGAAAGGAAAGGAADAGSDSADSDSADSAS
ncbi:hypothetical protein MCEMIE22_00792 [Mycobacteriaceae bacterium]